LHGNLEYLKKGILKRKRNFLGQKLLGQNKKPLGRTVRGCVVVAFFQPTGEV